MEERTAHRVCSRPRGERARGYERELLPERQPPNVFPTPVGMNRIVHGFLL